MVFENASLSSLCNFVQRDVFEKKYSKDIHNYKGFKITLKQFEIVHYQFYYKAIGPINP